MPLARDIDRAEIPALVVPILRWFPPGIGRTRWFPRRLLIAGGHASRLSREMRSRCILRRTSRIQWPSR